MGGRENRSINFDTPQKSNTYSYLNASDVNVELVRNSEEVALKAHW